MHVEERHEQPANVHEPLWPVAVALLAVGIMNLFLPKSLRASPGWSGVAVVGVLWTAAVLFPKWHTWFGHTNSGFATFQLGYALWALVRDITNHQAKPAELLQAALVLWTMNVIVFASWYWRLDAGGPHRRSRRSVYCGGAFLFPQLTLGHEVRRALGAEGWRPRFVDYLFLAFNTSTAFSPTDSPVLSAWAKVLMMVQSSISLMTLAMVAARAVNIL